MSAFVVSHDHINALLTFADLKRMRDELAYDVNSGSKKLTLTDIGRILLAENERSVCHRYPDCVPGNCPGKIGEEATGYQYRPFQQLYKMQHGHMLAFILKACDCFDYQACETDDYDQSIAHGMIERIRARAIRMLPGYENAPWGIH